MIDFKKINSKLTELQTKGKKNDSIWKPAPGKNVVRIVPYQHNKDWPFIELLFQYNVNKKTLLSPMTFKRPDPINEFGEKLKKTGDKNDWLMGRKLDPQLRVFVPILVRGKEEEGVKFWGFGNGLYQEILKLIDDPDYGDVTDITTGRDLIVEFLKPEEAGNTFGKTTIRCKPAQTVATADSIIMEKVLNHQKNIMEFFPEPSYDELTTELEKWLNPDVAATATTDELSEATQPNKSLSAHQVGLVTKKAVVDESETKESLVSKKAATAKSKEKVAAKTTVADADTAFDELFN